MRIAVISLAEDATVQDGRLVPVRPIERFTLHDTPHVIRTETFVVLLEFSYPREESGINVRAETIIRNRAGDILASTNMGLGTLPALPDGGLVFGTRIPIVGAHFPAVGTHELRVTLRDLGVPDGGILARRILAFDVREMVP